MTAFLFFSLIVTVFRFTQGDPITGVAAPGSNMCLQKHRRRKKSVVRREQAAGRGQTFRTWLLFGWFLMVFIQLEPDGDKVQLEAENQIKPMNYLQTLQEGWFGLMFKGCWSSYHVDLFMYLLQWAFVITDASFCSTQCFEFHPKYQMYRV